MQAETRPQENEELLDRWAARLALSEAEVAAIVRTGSIASELRGRSTRIFRLYFYQQGKRRTKYLGSQEQEIASLRELLEARRERQAQRAVRKQSLALAAAEIREQCRQVRRQLLPVLEASGVYLHGVRVRRRRKFQVK